MILRVRLFEFESLDPVLDVLLVRITAPDEARWDPGASAVHTRNGAHDCVEQRLVRNEARVHARRYCTPCCAKLAFARGDGSCICARVWVRVWVWVWVWVWVCLMFIDAN